VLETQLQLEQNPLDGPADVPLSHRLSLLHQPHPLVDAQLEQSAWMAHGSVPVPAATHAEET
jgi:hypothetical protein